MTYLLFVSEINLSKRKIADGMDGDGSPSVLFFTRPNRPIKSCFAFPLTLLLHCNSIFILFIAHRGRTEQKFLCKLVSQEEFHSCLDCKKM